MIKIETVLDILKKDGLFEKLLTKVITTTTTAKLFLIASATTAEK